MACWFEYKGKRYDQDQLVGALKEMTPTEAAKYIDGVKSVPDAPFQKSWQELALKRMVREAAENGYDRVSWTPGAAHNRRYPGRPEKEQRGMEYFYDDIIPKSLEKLFKKHGVKVQRGELPQSAKMTTAEKAQKIGMDHGDFLALSPDERNAALRNAGVRTGEPIWYFDLPQSLRDEAMGKGFAMFADPGKAGAPAAALAKDDEMHRADGGKVMSDAEFESAGAPVMDDAAFESAKPAKADGIMPSWTPRAITDVPGEIYEAGADAVKGMSNLVPGYRDRSKEGFFEGPLKTARGVLAIPEFVMSPLTGAARSLLGHPLAAVEDAGRKFSGMPADEAGSYKRAKGDVDKSLLAIGSRKPGPAARMPDPPETIGDFGVPLTEGEAMGDFGKIARQHRVLRSDAVEGRAAHERAKDFMTHRDEELTRARGEISREMDPHGLQVAENPQDAAQMTGASVRQTADDLKRLSKDRYEEMRELPGEFKPEAFEGVGNRIKADLSAGDNPVIVDTTTPIAARALADIDQNISRLRIPNAADPAGAPDIADIVGVNLKGVDQQRKRLVQFYGDAKGYPPTPDQRAMQAIIKGFDDQVENAIVRGLFSGDPRALDALKEARGFHAQYRKLFTPQGSGDDVGRAMQHIMGTNVREPATPAEIANMLYGTANTGAKGLSFRLADRLKTVLGADSPEWSGIKQGLFSRLTETPPGVTDWGPQKVANNIDKFLNGDGRALSQRMYDQPQRELMQRYADLLRKTIPPPGAVNYSNNLQWAAQFRDGVTKFLTAAVGHHIGGTTGAVLGYAAGLVGKPIANAKKAREIASMMPTIADSMKRWDKAIAAANRVGQPNSTAVRAATTNLVTRLKDMGLTESAMRQLMGSPAAGAQDKEKQP